jgi:hypothetical protein
MSVVPRSPTEQVWLWVKLCIANRSLDTDYTTLEEFYEWIVERIVRVKDFPNCKFELLPSEYSETAVGEFVEALRQTPNLRKINDMSPQMLYLAMCLSNRMDFHPDTLQRAIEADHVSVGLMVIHMGAEAFLEFVTKRQIPLGVRTLEYLAEYDERSTERSAEFQTMAQNLNDGLWWYRGFERLYCMPVSLWRMFFWLNVITLFVVCLELAFSEKSVVLAIGEELSNNLG